jgi:long-subunit acyl-CoA synthetase (AMP-forming)
VHWFPRRTIGDVLRATVDRPALIYGARSWTWAEFVEEVDRLAVGLMGIGVEAGDHVGLWMTNRPEWLFAMFAIPRIGAVSGPLNTRYRVDDASYAIDQSDITTLLAIDRSWPIDYLAMLSDTSSNHLSWDTMLAAGASVSPAELEARASSVDPDLPMLIVYTSGTTSAPKGAVHSHAWLRRVAERAQLLGLRHDDVHLSYLPLFHAYGYSESA